jgi:hypothetical protein
LQKQSTRPQTKTGAFVFLEVQNVAMDECFRSGKGRRDADLTAAYRDLLMTILVGRSKKLESELIKLFSDLKRGQINETNEFSSIESVLRIQFVFNQILFLLSISCSGHESHGR